MPLAFSLLFDSIAPMSSWLLRSPRVTGGPPFYPSLSPSHGISFLTHARGIRVVADAGPFFCFSLVREGGSIFVWNGLAMFTVLVCIAALRCIFLLLALALSQDVRFSPFSLSTSPANLLAPSSPACQFVLPGQPNPGASAQVSPFLPSFCLR